MKMEKGIIYSSMKKHRIKFLLIEILLVVIFVSFFVSSYPYIANYFGAKTVLDEDLFSEKVQTVKIPEPFKLHRNDDGTIPDYALKGSSYWQGMYYEFDVAVKDAEKTQLSFTNATTNTGKSGAEDEISAVLHVMDVGGVKTLVLTYPETDLENASEIKGIFTEIPLIVMHDLAQTQIFENDTQICTYMLDTRGVEMESEGFDTVFSIVLLLIIIFLLIKLILQFSNYRKTPTYKQLEKYGDMEKIEKEIERELTEVVFNKKETITENWILKEDTFKLKIVKNHIKHGRFEYVPKPR